jgi:hypothetical protein
LATIHLVVDNLNIHPRKSLTDYYGDGGELDLGAIYRPESTQS